MLEDFVPSDRLQQPPQFTAVLEFVLPLRRVPENSSQYRLDNILRRFASAEAAIHAPRGQRFQLWTKLLVHPLGPRIRGSVDAAQ
jgi:hypothetical protein